MNATAVPLLNIFEKKMRLEVPLFQRQYVGGLNINGNLCGRISQENSLSIWKAEETRRCIFSVQWY